MSDTNAITRIVDAYLTCGLWSTTLTDEQGVDLGSFDDFFDIDDCTNREDVEAELTEYLVANLDDIVWVFTERKESGRHPDDIWADIGHDICLSRDGHGTGFWDRGYGIAGQRLHDATKPYGGSEFMPNDHDNHALGFNAGGSTR